MNYTINFGKNRDRTYEWVFFNNSVYAQWLYDNNILRTPNDYDRMERDYFDELYNRASHLAGICRHCSDDKPVTRQGTLLYKKTAEVSLCCDSCEPFEGVYVNYSKPSMFLPEGWPDKYQALIAQGIAKYYDGPVKMLTQEKMESFLHNDSYFAKATPGFFPAIEKEVAAR